MLPISSNENKPHVWLISASKTHPNACIYENNLTICKIAFINYYYYFFNAIWVDPFHMDIYMAIHVTYSHWMKWVAY